jgi:adenylosuccinate synthase
MIVLGMGFGDEGKGLTTSYLCSKIKDPIVVRFSGGHQAGHTVVHEGTRHVFSNFGSGTLQGAMSYWSKYCTVHPVGIYNEYLKLGLTDIKLVVHPLCPVTTPYDIKHNQRTELECNHGSCGVGFGSTLHRQENHYKLFVQDLFYPAVFQEKLRKIASFYSDLLVSEEEMDVFMATVHWLTTFIVVEDESWLPQNGSVIYEGSQGILLDKDFGFFPNVTRSNTTSRNALEISNNTKEEIFYVTRSYQTRHGNGFMTYETKNLDLKNNELETNKSNPWQGDFRIGTLDRELLNYAIECDNHFSAGLKKNLVVTCMDQFQGITPEEIVDRITVCKFSRVFASYGPNLTDIKQIR